MNTIMMSTSNFNVKELVLDVHGCNRDLTCPDIAKQSIVVLRNAAESVGATVRDIHCTTYWRNK